MEISKVTKYRCDICSKESEWIKGTWIAHTFLLSSSYGGHEHEFHLCSQYCEERILRLTRRGRSEIFKRMEAIKLQIIMTKQQKSDREKAKKAWIDLHKGLNYIQGREDFKSSLKRDIEKEIEDNKNDDQYEDYAKTYIAALEWIKNKIETVEP